MYTAGRELFPFSCASCEELVEADVHKCNCPWCGDVATSYADPVLLGKPGLRDELECGGLKLTDGDYYCPRCRSFSLRFSKIGSWD